MVAPLLYTTAPSSTQWCPPLYSSPLLYRVAPSSTQRCFLCMVGPSSTLVPFLHCCASDALGSILWWTRILHQVFCLLLFCPLLLVQSFSWLPLLCILWLIHPSTTFKAHEWSSMLEITSHGLLASINFFMSISHFLWMVLHCLRIIDSRSGTFSTKPSLLECSRWQIHIISESM